MRNRYLKMLQILLANVSDNNFKRFVLMIGFGLFVTLLKHRISKESQMKFHLEIDTTTKEEKKLKGKVDKKFFRKLMKLIKISIPSLIGRETLVIVLLSVALILRTILSIHVSDVNGGIVKSIVRMNRNEFFNRLFVLGLYSLPSSIINSSLELFNKLLGLYLRENLTKYFHEKYLKNKCFYQITNWDTRIANPDQIFTNDIEKWAYSLSSLFSNFSKPILDIFLFSRKLSEQLGYRSPIITILWYIFVAMIMRYISPHFGNLIVIEQNLEGEFRACHRGIISHSEEIAFYRGNKWEKQRLNDIFNDLLSHLDIIYSKRFLVVFFESLILKYGSVIIGYYLLGLPIFRKKEVLNEYMDVGDITRDYITNSQNLINLSKAIGRIISSYKDMQKLAGYTFLVNRLDKVVDDVNNGKFIRTQVNEKEILRNYMGEYLLSNNIEFVDVPIITPNGDTLVNSISFTISKGHHTLITGPNGCGKSSLFRILGKLWPLYGGTLKSPNITEIFYIPQRPYLPFGTLRDQVIYPVSLSEFISLGKTDQVIKKLLEKVDLDNILMRFSSKGLDTVRDWNDVLSGGEKQRIAIARLFFHNPKYAILDECTSACSIDIENKMFTYAKSLGITLITVSHRPSLWKYHKSCIRFLGDGKIQIDKITNEANSN